MKLHRIRPLHIAAAFALLAALYAPVTSLALAAGAAWDEILLPALRSAALAAGAGIAATAFGSAVALVIWDQAPRRARKILSDVIYLTAGLPPMTVAVAAFLLLPDARPTARLAAALILANTPYAARYMLDDLRATSPYAIDTLRALGAGGTRTLLAGTLPGARAAMRSTALHTCLRVFTEVAVLSVLLPPTEPYYLTMELTLRPLSEAAFPAALALCAAAMLLFDRAQAVVQRRKS